MQAAVRTIVQSVASGRNNVISLEVGSKAAAALENVVAKHPSVTCAVIWALRERPGRLMFRIGREFALIGSECPLGAAIAGDSFSNICFRSSGWDALRAGQLASVLAASGVYHGKTTSFECNLRAVSACAVVAQRMEAIALEHWENVPVEPEGVVCDVPLPRWFGNADTGVVESWWEEYFEAGSEVGESPKDNSYREELLRVASIVEGESSASDSEDEEEEGRRKNRPTISTSSPLKKYSGFEFDPTLGLADAVDLVWDVLVRFSKQKGGSRASNSNHLGQIWSKTSESSKKDLAIHAGEISALSMAVAQAAMHSLAQLSKSPAGCTEWNASSVRMTLLLRAIISIAYLGTKVRHDQVPIQAAHNLTRAALAEDTHHIPTTLLQALQQASTQPLLSHGSTNAALQHLLQAITK